MLKGGERSGFPQPRALICIASQYFVQMDDKSYVRLRVRINSECEHTFWGLAAHLEDAAFLVVSGLLIAVVVGLLSYGR